VYEKLRAVARQRMMLERGGGAGHTLGATAVVHEAFARLAKGGGGADGGPRWTDQGAFFVAASREIERVLVDHARAKFAVKRGGDPAQTGRVRVPLDVVDLAREADSASTMALHEAIVRLEEEDPQAALVVRLRFFGGLSVPETAVALGISERTVNRDWAFARAFLGAHLGAGADGEGQDG